MKPPYKLLLLALAFLLLQPIQAQDECCQIYNAKIQLFYDDCNFDIAIQKIDVMENGCKTCPNDVSRWRAKVQRCKNNPNAEGCPCATPTNPISTQNTLFNYECVYVAGGTYTMGCTSEQGSDCYDWEKPAHTVSVNSFNIGKYEVTQAQWQAIMGTNPSNFKNCDNCPVENVSWDDIQVFIQKVKEKTGKSYRLPTEAEWEFAARGGNSSRGYKYSGSNDLASVAWYDGNSGSTTHHVGQKTANELGIYDMSGNVWEWCEDDWHNPYTGSPNNGVAWINSPRGSDRVLRGGSWFNTAWNCRVSYRYGYTPDYRNGINGFRLVCLP